MSKQYFIYENGQPMDGEFYVDAGKLGNALRYASADARVFEMDLEAGTVTDYTDDAATDACIMYGDWCVISEISELPPFIQANVADEDSYTFMRDAQREIFA